MFQEELGGQVSMNCQMTCVCSGRGFIFVGDDAGRVHFLNRRMEVKTLKLFEGDVEQLLQVNSSPNIPKIRAVKQIILLASPYINHLTIYTGTPNKSSNMCWKGQHIS